MENQELQIKNILGRRIREERNKRGWTIEQLAEKVNLSPSFLGCVERGERALSIEKLYTISELFEVTTDSLIKGHFPYPSKAESMLLLVKDLDDHEYKSIYEIAKTAKLQIAGKKLKG